MSLKKATTIMLLSSLILLVMVLTGCNSTKEYLSQIYYNDLKNKIENKESFALYIGNKSCLHCKDFEPKFRGVVNEYKVTVFKIDTATLTTDEYQEVIVGNIGEVGTPTVVFFEKGVEKGTYSRIDGDVSKDKVIDKLKDNGYIKD
jgi:predicted bacteriocin transport accessory protein